MIETAEVTLPNGFWLEGRHHRDARLRSMNGRDEADILEMAGCPPAERTTRLLTRCLERLGPWSPAREDAVRDLTVGDREALLLHLRRLTVADRIECVVTCPEEDCGELLDLELSVEALTLPPYETAAATYERPIAAGGDEYRARFRLPTGRDQEAVVALAESDPEEAGAEIVRRCVDRVVRDGEDERPVSNWPTAVRDAVSEAMAELDPQAELALNVDCAACGRRLTTFFDAGAFLLREMAAGIDRLFREVHLLAYHYHWGESEIMGLSARKRRRYLRLLVDELSREGRP